MWCPQCESDVAAEVSSDDRRARCAVCGSFVQTGFSGPLEQRTRHALQLLERWSRTNVVGEFEPVAEPVSTPLVPRASAGEPPAVVRETGAPPRRASERVDALGLDATPTREPPPKPRSPERQSPERAEPPREAPPERRPDPPRQPRPKPVARRVDAAHDTPPPNDGVRHTVPREDEVSNWIALAGQLLAYLGVAVLTVGTMLVLWGHFGGRSEYTPTGWLTAAAGQMLLFLGVVTLVSSGIEQSSEDVRRRTDRLCDRIVRLESLLERHLATGGRTGSESGPDDEDESRSRWRRHAA